jgi:hypothetical protein
MEFNCINCGARSRLKCICEHSSSNDAAHPEIRNSNLRFRSPFENIRIMRRNHTLEGISVELHDLLGRVQNQLESFSLIEETLIQQLTNVIHNEKKNLIDLITEIHSKFKEIESIKRDPSATGNKLIDTFSKHNLSGILQKYQELDPIDINYILDQLSRHLELPLTPFADAQKLLRRKDKRINKLKSKVSKLVNECESLNEQIRQNQYNHQVLYNQFLESKENEEKILNDLVDALKARNNQLEIDYQNALHKNKEMQLILLDIQGKSDHIIPLNSQSESLCLHESYIIAAKNETRELIRYDVDTDSVTSYSLDMITHPFKHASTCILPNQHIMIAGGLEGINRFLSDTYEVNLSTLRPRVIKLKNLNYSRMHGKMVYFSEYVYMLGGWNRGPIRKCERLKVGETEWAVLPDMKQTRCGFGVFIKDNRIYMIGGEGATSIEFYDLRLNSFYLIQNIQLPQFKNLCGIFDNKIYMIGKHLRVFSKDFQLIQSQNDLTHIIPNSYSNEILRDYKLYYIDSDKAKVFAFDCAKRLINVVRQLDN